MRNIADVTGKPIVVLLHPLVAFYDIHGGKREVLLFCPGQFKFYLHHHQPIHVPNAGAQAFLMDYLQGERAITHHAGRGLVGANDCK
jgi:hypothetical protein